MRCWRLVRVHVRLYRSVEEVTQMGGGAQPCTTRKTTYTLPASIVCLTFFQPFWAFAALCFRTNPSELFSGMYSASRL